MNVTDCPLEEAESIGQLRSTDPADVVTCNARYAEDGYLLFRKVLDEGDVLRVKQDIMQVLQRQNLLKPNEGEPLWTGAGYERVDDGPLYALDSYADLFDTAPMRQLLEQAFGEPAFVARCITIRFAIPRDAIHVSAAHQDGFYVPGIAQLRTLWVPLMAIDRRAAPLAVAAGSHTAGARQHIEQADLESYILKGRKQSGINWQGTELNWQTTDFAPGDVLMFHRHTIHRALPNSSSRIRLSLDTRCHPESIPATFQNQRTILELRQYRQRALDTATQLGVGQALFERVILEMMERGIAAEKGPMQQLVDELTKMS